MHLWHMYAKLQVVTTRNRIGFARDLRAGVNWVVEAYESLDDLTFDLFFEMYSKDFSSEKLSAWIEFKKELEKYDKTLPQFPDVREVFQDPNWQRVREAAARFVAAFEQEHPALSPVSPQ